MLISTEKKTGNTKGIGSEKQMKRISFLDICLRNLIFVLLISRYLNNIKNMSEIIEANKNTLKPIVLTKN